jgi:hypothetical protein
MPTLRSAYAGYSPALLDAPFTTKTDRRCSTIDYIFYSPQHMFPTACLGHPPLCGWPASTCTTWMLAS